MEPRPPDDARIQQTLEVLSPRWAAPILYALLSVGEMRFGSLRSRVEGITDKLLAVRLKELEKRGLVSRRVVPVFPPESWYAVTEAASGLDAVFLALASWEAP